MLARRIIAGSVGAVLLTVTGSATQITDDQILGEWWPWLWGLTAAAMVVACVRADAPVTWWPAGLLLCTIAASRIPVALNNGGILYPVPIARFAASWYLLGIVLTLATWWLAAPRRP